jgi:hypothetical protein
MHTRGTVSLRNIRRINGQCQEPFTGRWCLLGEKQGSTTRRFRPVNLRLGLLSRINHYFQNNPQLADFGKKRARFLEGKFRICAGGRGMDHTASIGGMTELEGTWKETVVALHVFWHLAVRTEEKLKIPAFININ